MGIEIDKVLVKVNSLYYGLDLYLASQKIYYFLLFLKEYFKPKFAPYFLYNCRIESLTITMENYCISNFYIILFNFDKFITLLKKS